MSVWHKIAWATRALLVGACLLYCAALWALAALWVFAPMAAWWVVLSNLVAPHLFTPLALLVPLTLLLRSRWLRGATLALLGLFALLFGPRLLPPTPATHAGPRLRVLTLNQHQYRPPRRIPELLAMIRAQDADLVALQELTPVVAAALRRELRDHYPYQLLAPAADDTGLALLSRLPLRPLPAQPGIESQRAALELRGKALTLVNVHLSSPQLASGYPDSLPALEAPLITGYDSATRDAEVAALAAYAAREPGALLVLGDLNFGEREPAYALLAAQLHDAFREAAWGFGFTFPDTKRLFKVPYPYALLRIDYIWARGLAPAAAWRDCGHSSSDHCAVVAELVLAELVVTGDR